MSPSHRSLAKSRRREIGGSKLLYSSWVSPHSRSKCPSCTQSVSLGYYNPVLAYGEQKAIQDASEAGANGFIMVDLPPEEAIAFRDKCTTAGYSPFPFACLHHFQALYSVSYVPLIAPSTTRQRIKFLTSIADSFIYVVSKVRLNHSE